MPKIPRIPGIHGSPKQLHESGRFVECLAVFPLFYSLMKLSDIERGRYRDGSPMRDHQFTDAEFRQAYALRVKLGLDEPGDAHAHYFIHDWCKDCDVLLRKEALALWTNNKFAQALALHSGVQIENDYDHRFTAEEIQQAVEYRRERGLPMTPGTSWPFYAEHGMPSRDKAPDKHTWDKKYDDGIHPQPPLTKSDLLNLDELRKRYCG